MIAIDTNVLLRYLLADDAAQHRADNRRYLHLLTLDDQKRVADVVMSFKRKQSVYDHWRVLPQA